MYVDVYDKRNGPWVSISNGRDWITANEGEVGFYVVKLGEQDNEQGIRVIKDLILYDLLVASWTTISGYPCRIRTKASGYARAILDRCRELNLIQW